MSLGSSSPVAAAPTVGAPRVVLTTTGVAAHTTTSEGLVGNGTDLFGVYVQPLGGNRSVLRGTFFTQVEEQLVPEIPTGIVVSGSLPRDTAGAAGSRRPTLAMNGRGTVLGAYANDVFRIGRDGAIGSIALRAGELPAAPLFPTTGGAQSVALVGSNADSFLFVACTPDACTLQRIADDGAPQGAASPLFTFTPGATSPALVEAVYVPDQGFVVVAAQGAQALTATVTPDAVTSPIDLGGPLAPQCIDAVVTSVRVGRGLGTASVQARLTTTCDTTSATWITLESLAPRTDALCGAATGVDECRFTSSDQGLFVNVGASVVSLGSGLAQSAPGWLAPLRAAPAPGGVLAVTANVPALARVAPEGPVTPGTQPWRQLTENAQLFALEGSTSAAAEGADFRAGIAQGDTRSLLAGPGAQVALPAAVTAPPTAVTALGDTTFVGTSGHLVRVQEGVPSVLPFGGLLALDHSDAGFLALTQQGSPGGTLLYALTLDPASFGPPNGGALPGSPAVVTRASALSNLDGSTELDVAFDGTKYLAVFTRASHLDGVLIAADGTLAGGPFPISTALHSQHTPRLTALPGGGFFVVWSDNRTSLAQSDIYGTFVDTNGAVAAPQGIAIVRSALHETRPYASPSTDPDHVIVVWSEYPEDTPRSALRVRGAAVSKSAQRAREPFTVEAGVGDHFAVGALPAGADGVVVYVAEQASPTGGSQVLARAIGTAKRNGEACAAGPECFTDTCLQGVCAEPAVPPGETCGDPCGVLDAATNACVAAPRGSAPSAPGCPGYVCDGASQACPTSCSSRADCTNDAECENQVCVVVRTCSGPTEVSERGSVRSCGALRCDPVRAECFDRCTSREQCADGLVCNELGGCVAPPAPAEGCQTAAPGSRGLGGAGLLVGLGMIAALRRRRRGLAAGALAIASIVAPRVASAADPRVGPSEPLAVVPGTTLASVAQLDAQSMMPVPLPGATATGLLRIADRGGSWRDGVFGPLGLSSFQAAAGSLGSVTHCDDGSVLAVERTVVDGRPLAWLVHYTDGPIPTHRIRVPENTTAGGACTTDGAWLGIAEVTNVYERYVWATGARAQRVETQETGTTPFFHEQTMGWVVVRGTSVSVVDAQRAPVSTFVPYPSRAPVVLGLGSRVLISFDSFDGENLFPRIGVAGATDVVAYVEGDGAALTPAMGGSMVVRGGRSATWLGGGQIFHAELPDTLVPVAVQRSPFAPSGGTFSAYVRNDRYELTFADGTRSERQLPALTELPVPPALVSATPRALRLASSAGGVTRLLGYQDAALTLFRPEGTAVPLAGVALPPADLQGLPDGRASLTSRDLGASAGYVLSATDTLSPFPLLDAATSTANLGDGIAAIHFVDVGGATRFTVRHISATVGETTRSVDVPTPTLEWGLRDITAVAPVGNEAYAVFVRGTGAGEQHLDWAHIEQGTVSVNAPLTRAFYRQANPKIACDPRGQRGCLVAWEDFRKSAYDSDVYIARILPDGTTPDGAGIPLAATARQEGEPSVVWTDDDDHFFVAWRDAERTENRLPGVDPSRIRGAFVRHDGTIEDPEGIELTDEPLDETAPILLPGARGVFRLAYQVFVGAADIASNQIALRTIQAGKLRGETCGADAECSGRTCIDGICCEATCRNGCGTCNQPSQLGVCVARPAGSSSYQDRCGSFLCDGTSTSCPATCSGDDDCTASSSCNLTTRQCEGADGTSCQDDVTQVDTAGVATACAPYRCDRGQCASRCVSNEQCAPGSVCTPSGRCEGAPPAAEGGCAAGPSSSTTSTSFGVLLAATALLAARRSRKHTQRK